MPRLPIRLERGVRVAATSLRGGGLDCVHYLSPNNRVGLVVENVGLCVHPLEVEEEIGDCGAHVRVADLSERWALLFNGDEVVGVGDEIGVVPIFRRLLRDGRRARWGRWGLALALLRRVGVEWGKFVRFLVCDVGRRWRKVCSLSLTLSEGV
eukprot:scaffold2348_cov114-Isochrysis_galbana.AAC.6